MYLNISDNSSLAKALGIHMSSWMVVYWSSTCI